MLIDTHCHIDLYPNPQKILQDLDKANIFVLAMTNLPSHFEMGYSFFLRLKKIRIALGMHPLMIKSDKRELNLFMRNMHKTSYIGEVGLDFSQDGIQTKDIQILFFESILKCIQGHRKLLSIHSRKAEGEVLRLLKLYGIKFAIFHWYTGKLSLINDIYESGYYFSINPKMTQSMSGRKIIAKIPKQFVLTETDGPFVDENNEILRPGQVSSVIFYLAKEWDMAVNEVENIITANFRRLTDQLR